jgi:PIN domain nuclease of toxin-antitoxin system
MPRKLRVQFPGAIYHVIHHRDPFDRLLLAQAKAEGMTLVTDDGQFGPYGAALLW